MKLIKTDIASNIVEAVEDVNIKDAKRMVDFILNTIVDEAFDDRKVQLCKLGSFTVASKDARPGLNPKTLERHQVQARKVLRFKPSTILKEALNATY